MFNWVFVSWEIKNILHKLIDCIEHTLLIDSLVIPSPSPSLRLHVQSGIVALVRCCHNFCLWQVEEVEEVATFSQVS